MMKRETIASLLYSGRADLANVVAYQVTGVLVLPPRQFEPFINKLVGRLRKLDRDALAWHKWFDDMNRQYRDADGYEYNPIEYMVVEEPDGYRQRGSGAFDYVLDRFATSSFGSSKRPLDEHATTIEQTWRSMKSWNAYDQLKGLGYMAADMDRAVESLERIEKDGEAFVQRGWIAKTMEEYENEYGGPGSSYSVVVKKPDLVRFDNIIQEVVRLAKDLKDAAVRLRHTASSKLAHYNDPKWEPESEDIETLYHASVDAKTIFRRKAFDTKVPEPKGLGGAQGDKRGRPAISFTSDLYVAKEIARSLKEAIMIARGEVKAAHILDWARRHGIHDDVERTFKSTYGPLDPKRVEHVMDLYRVYLTYHKTRYNPVFFGDMGRLMQTFKRQKVSDVGVLVCRVNMRDKDIAYLPAEHEYRVPPASVISVDKLIR